MTDTLLLRALAAILIANSHLEAFYPIRHLAADGLLGDSLFFFLSGFGLVLSEARERRAFAEWSRRRLGRIWPAVATAVLVFDLALLGGWRSWGWREYLANFAWGACYPFIPQILAMYALAFPIIRWGRPSAPLAVAIGLLPLFALAAIRRDDTTYHLLHAVFYFQMMLFGAWLARGGPTIEPGGRRELLALAAILAVYLGARAATAMGAVPRRAFLAQMLVPAIAYLLLRLARSDEVVRLLARRPVGAAVAAIGGMSLEIYLAHLQILGLRPIASLAFPLNVVAFFALSLALAWALARSAAALRALGERGRPPRPASVAAPAAG